MLKGNLLDYVGGEFRYTVTQSVFSYLHASWAPCNPMLSTSSHLW